MAAKSSSCFLIRAVTHLKAHGPEENNSNIPTKRTNILGKSVLSHGEVENQFSYQLSFCSLSLLCFSSPFLFSCYCLQLLYYWHKNRTLLLKLHNLHPVGRTLDEVLAYFGGQPQLGSQWSQRDQLSPTEGVGHLDRWWHLALCT